jgi:hypothetical protein
MGSGSAQGHCRSLEETGINGVGKGDQHIRRNGEPGAVRTHDPRLKRALLYQLSYGLSRC